MQISYAIGLMMLGLSIFSCGYCSGLTGPGDVDGYQDSLTEPWLQMNLPIEGGQVLDSGADSLAVGFDRQVTSVATLKQQVPEALTTSGWGLDDATKEASEPIYRKKNQRLQVLFMNDDSGQVVYEIHMLPSEAPAEPEVASEPEDEPNASVPTWEFSQVVEISMAGIRMDGRTTDISGQCEGPTTHIAILKQGSFEARVICSGDYEASVELEPAKPGGQVIVAASATADFGNSETSQSLLFPHPDDGSWVLWTASYLESYEEMDPMDDDIEPESTCEHSSEHFRWSANDNAFKKFEFKGDSPRKLVMPSFKCDDKLPNWYFQSP